jgi:CHAT domain-containing protein
MSLLKGRFIAISLLCFGVCFAAFRTLPAFAQENDAEAIRSLVEKFFAAYQKEDLEVLMSLWSTDAAGVGTIRQSFQQTFADNQSIEIKNLDVGKVTSEAGKLKVQITVEVNALSIRTGQPGIGSGKLCRTMQIVKEGTGLKIWKYVSSDEDFAADLLTAKNEEERKTLLSQNKERVTSALVSELNNQGRTFFGQSRFAQALSVYEIGLSIAGQLEDKRGASLILIGVGNARYMQGNYPGAADAFRQSLKMAEEAGNKMDIARAWGSIGTAVKAQGDNTSALEMYLKSLKLREELGDKAGISLMLSNLGGVYYALGRYDEALEIQARGLALSEELGDKSGISAALNNMGAVYLIRGDYQRALDMKLKNVKLKEELGDQQGLVHAFTSLGQTYYESGDLQQALEFFQKSLQLANELGIKAGIASALNSIGNVHYAQGNFALALEFMLKGLKMDEELGDKTSLAITLNNIGAVYNDQGNHTLALESLERSHKLATEVGYEQVIVSTLTNLCQTHQYLNNHERALEYARRAIDLTRQSDNAWVLWQALTSAGESYVALNRNDLARESFLEAISSIEKLREKTTGGERGQQRFFENKVSPYYAMVELSIKQQNVSEALVYAERAKGRVLLDVLSSGRVNIDKAMTREEVAKDQTLTNNLNALNTQISRLKYSSNSAELSELTVRLEKARLEYEGFQAGLYAAHPELKVQRGKAHTFNIDEAARLLSDDRTALFEYVVGEKNSYLFVITKGTAPAKPTLNVYPLNLKGKELAEASERFRERVAARDLTIKTLGQKLYDQLIKPAEKQLKGVNKIVIVPDGSLWDLPFQALHRGQKGYLLEDFAVSYAPSLSVLREMNRKGNEFRLARMNPQTLGARNVRTSLANSSNFVPELLALGNPVLNVEAVAKTSVLRSGESLGPLPSAELEANTLGKLYGRARSKVLIGKEATEEEVKADAGKYRLLHFATHAILDDRNPMYSHIMLSPTGDNSREDGLLEAWELMNLDLRAEMVVLSACQTARGRVGAGEGMIGMSWSLFVAGSPTVVVSQWKVDSASTAELMIEFHRNLLRRGTVNKLAMTKAEALREAALKLLHGQYNHPAYWAGFVLIGNEK